MNTAANAMRSLRPAASRFQPSALPRLARAFSASARRSYEYIEVSEPRPGVGQGAHPRNWPWRSLY
jgi:enoyl-CoA hydratase